MEFLLFIEKTIFKKCLSCGKENKFPVHRINEAKCGNCGKKLQTAKKSVRYISKRYSISVCQNAKFAYQQMYDHIFDGKLNRCVKCSSKAKTYFFYENDLSEVGRIKAKEIDNKNEKFLKTFDEELKKRKKFIEGLIVISVLIFFLVGFLSLILYDTPNCPAWEDGCGIAGGGYHEQF